MERDLTDPASCVCNNLRRAARNLSRSYDAAMAPCGLNAGQFAALVTIGQMGPATVSTIAQEMDVERSALTRNLSVLERSGLLERIEGEDRRERIITLRADGHERLELARPLWAQAQSAIVSRLGPSGTQRLLRELAAFR